jgi:hypothetical protein
LFNGGRGVIGFARVLRSGGLILFGDLGFWGRGLGIVVCLGILIGFRCSREDGDRLSYIDRCTSGVTGVTGGCCDIGRREIVIERILDQLGGISILIYQQCPIP